MDILIDALLVQFPQISLILSIVGSLVVVASLVDSLIPDEKDGGFSKKLFAIPVVGQILESIKRFSLLRSEKKDEEPKE